jgi:hypothetical protein
MVALNHLKIKLAFLKGIVKRGFIGKLRMWRPVCTLIFEVRYNMIESLLPDVPVENCGENPYNDQSGMVLRTPGAGF